MGVLHKGYPNFPIIHYNEWSDLDATGLKG